MKSEGDCGEIGGMKIGRGTEVLGENLPQRQFVHHKSHMTRSGIEPGLPRWDASDYPLELLRGLKLQITFLRSKLLVVHTIDREEWEKGQRLRFDKIFLRYFAKKDHINKIIFGITT
jgi:hypothetical protein